MSVSALVAGSAGLVGSHLVKLLINSSESSKVKELLRKGRAHQMKGIDVLEVDFDRLEDYQAHPRADYAFCCLGTTIKKAGSKENFCKGDFDYLLSLAKFVNAI